MRALCYINSYLLLILLIVGCKPSAENPNLRQSIWKVSTQKEWESTILPSDDFEIKNGKVTPLQKVVIVTSTLKKFNEKQKLDALILKQSPKWDSWMSVPKVTPVESTDAPVFIPVSDGDYWLLARLKGDNENGYHSWHSTDMESWEHYGPVSTLPNKWVTSAEYVDGKFYIYYDYPNDEDPHLIIDEDLTDGIQGKEMSMVLNDPSHGSDMGILRDDDGTFHLFYEDWSPLNPRKHSWDSPLAGHADSPDGIYGFEPHEFTPPIDERTTPTGKMEPYQPHPNQFVEGKDLSPYEYEIHEGPQDAFGDYTAIKVGDQYYIFCDYDSHDENKSMRVGRWRSDDITKQFVWDGEIGEGFHPDPTIGFAEGKFYLLVQRSQEDFVSDGPWVDGVEVRVGVDTNKDSQIDQWTDFTKVKESYAQKEGFVKVIEALPATLDVSGLEAGYGFKIEFRLRSKNGHLPVIDGFEAAFDHSM